MKKLIIFAKPCFAVVFICSAVLIFANGDRETRGGGFPRHGNGNLTTSEISLSSFDAIRITSNAQVIFHESTDYRAVVTVDSNLEEYVKISINGRSLEIGTVWGIYIFTTYKVELYCPSLSAVSISGSGSFDGKDKITCSENFNASISGSGKLNGDIECDRFSARISGYGDMDFHVICNSVNAGISGSGTIKLTGNGKDSSVTISGSGDFLASEFMTDNLNFRISGSGDLQAWVLNSLKGSTSGSGRIRYRGNPVVEFRGSGMGYFEKEL
jgi:hypothetical protein